MEGSLYDNDTCARPDAFFFPGSAGHAGGGEIAADDRYGTIMNGRITNEEFCIIIVEFCIGAQTRARRTRHLTMTPPALLVTVRTCSVFPCCFPSGSTRHLAHLQQLVRLQKIVRRCPQEQEGRRILWQQRWRTGRLLTCPWRGWSASGWSRGASTARCRQAHANPSVM